ncbi:MAG: Lrp/AsnC ligand binding domain-containing protein [Chitinophagales bacterium]
MGKNYTIDNVDRQILHLLMQNGLMPYSEIAKKIHVSSGTVHVRLKKMTNSGVISGNQLIVDPEKLGFDITAFIGVYLKKSSLYQEVLKGMKEIPEVVSCHYTTGNYSMFVKILCRDTNHLKAVLHDKLQELSGIDRTETFISLERSINRQISPDLSED